MSCNTGKQTCKFSITGLFEADAKVRPTLMASGSTIRVEASCRSTGTPLSDDNGDTRYKKECLPIGFEGIERANKSLSS